MPYTVHCGVYQYGDAFDDLEDAGGHARDISAHRDGVVRVVDAEGKTVRTYVHDGRVFPGEVIREGSKIIWDGRRKRAGETDGQ